eukprot:1148138-Pelagomonas_calceolata.AAC.2
MRSGFPAPAKPCAQLVKWLCHEPKDPACGSAGGGGGLAANSNAGRGKRNTLLVAHLNGGGGGGDFRHCIRTLCMGFAAHSKRDKAYVT